MLECVVIVESSADAETATKLAERVLVERVEMIARLTFDPCEEADRLNSNSFEEPERVKNPKVVLRELTDNHRLRERQCWEETSLELLQQRGSSTGLTTYLQEIEQRLIPIITQTS